MSKDALPKKRTETLVNKKKLEKIKRSKMFMSANVPGDPEKTRRFFIFRWKGDEIEGILSGPITNIRRNTSYPIELDDGSVFEIFGNKTLHGIIRDNELIGSRVRIVYIGLQKIPHMSRMRKIYEVYKVEGWDLEVPQHPKQKGD